MRWKRALVAPSPGDVSGPLSVRRWRPWCRSQSLTASRTNSVSTVPRSTDGREQAATAGLRGRGSAPAGRVREDEHRGTRLRGTHDGRTDRSGDRSRAASWRNAEDYVKSLRAAWEPVLRLAAITDAAKELDGDLHWRDLRHESGSRFADDGMDARHIQMLMGHANLKTTERYLNSDTKRLAEAMTRAAQRSAQPVILRSSKASPARRRSRKTTDFIGGPNGSQLEPNPALAEAAERTTSLSLREDRTAATHSPRHQCRTESSLAMRMRIAIAAVDS
jgi:integrase-like protein